MELIQGFIQPPKIQSAEETIPTLCDRVENATLINDRRSAILGLKAFAREYRELVVASGLKPLINTLKRDYVDENSVKAILEALLILFIRGDGDDDLTRSWISQQSRLQNGKYPSPLVMKQEKQQADQFSLWIADAITQSDELVHLLIQLLDTGNFHIRLYTIQLLEAVVATRPTRSRSAIISLPTGVSTLVTLLEDIHEPIRDEAILLLMAVVNESSHVQVLVAFENIFDRLFDIIQEEGGLRGSIVVNDCLSLIHNILKYNTSNQTLFLETGNLPKLAQVLNEPISGEEFFWNEQRVVNINTALDIVSLTVDPTSSTTPKNQMALLESNVLMVVLRLAFHYNIPRNARPIALLSASNMIKGNSLAQREFGKIDVPYFDPSLPSAKAQDQFVPIVVLLLNWTLYTNSVHLFSLRVAADELLKSYLHGNNEIRLEFLKQQIEDYSGKAPAFVKSNLFEAILDYDLELKLNPYKLFFATDFFIYLFESDDSDSNAIREMTRKVTTGSGLDEEEKLTSIQTISELTITSLTSEDIRIPVSYITFLIFWFYGDQNAVNDFLTNRSTIQSLLSFSYQVEGDDIAVKCLVTMLLGVSYEFSSKHSPFPRKPYFEYITKTLGKDNYSSRISQFKRDSVFSEAPKELSLDPKFDETGLPQIYFSPYFVTFLNENYYRIKTALLHNCEEEPYTKISYETFEELQGHCHALREEIKKLESDRNSSLLEYEKKVHSLTEEYEKLTNKYEKLEKNHSGSTGQLSQIEKELKEVKESLRSVTNERDRLSIEKVNQQKALVSAHQSNTSNGEKLKSLEETLKKVTANKNKAEEGINKMNRELMALTRSKGDLDSKIKDLQKKNDKLTNEYNKKEKSFEGILEKKDKNLESLKTNIKHTEERITSLNSERNALIKESKEWKSKFQSHDDLVLKMTEKLKSLSESYKGLQSERDALARSLEETKIGNTNELEAYKNGLEKLSTERDQLTLERQQILEKVSSSHNSYESLSQKHKKDTLILNEEVEKLRQNVGKLKVQEEELRVSRNQAIENAKGLQNQCNTYEENLKDQEHSKKETEKRFIELKQNFEVSTKDHERLVKEKQELNKARQLDTREFETLKKELDEKNQQSKSLIPRIQELEKQIGHYQTTNKDSECNWKEKVEVLETGKKEAVSYSQKLEHDLEKLKNDYKSLSEQDTKKLEELSKRVLEVEKQRDDNQIKLQKIESQLQEKSKSFSSLKELHESDKNNLREVQDKLDKLLHDKDALDLEKNSLNENLDKKERDLKEVQEKVKALEESEKKKISELEELRREYGDYQDFKKKEIVSLEKSRYGLAKDFEGLQTEMKNNKQENKKSTYQLEKQKEELSTELNNLKKSFEEIADKKDKKITGLETSKEKLSLDFSQLTTKSELHLKENGGKIQQLEKEKSENSEKAAELQKKADIDLEEKQKRIKDLESSEKKISNELSKLKRNSQKDREELDDLKKDLQKKVQEFEKERKLLNEGSDAVTKQYSERITVLEEKLHQIEVECQNKSKDLENTKLVADESSGELKIQLEEKVSEIKSLKSSVDQQGQIIDKLELDLKNSAESGKTRVDGLNGELERIKKDLLEKEAQIKENKNDLHGGAEERKNLEETIKLLQKELEESSKVSKDLENQGDLLKKTQENLVEEKETVVKKLETTVQGLREENEQRSKRLKVLESETKSLRVNLEMRTKEKNESIAQFNSQVSHIEKLKKELEQNSDELKKVKNEDESSGKQLDKIFKEKESLHKELEQKTKNVHNFHRELEHSADELRKYQAEKKTSIEKLEKLLKEKEESLTKLGSEVNKLSKSNQNLEVQLNQHSIKLSESVSIQEKNRKLNSELDAFRKDSDILRVDLEKARGSIYKHEETTSLHAEEKNSLTAKLEEAHRQLKSLNASTAEKIKEFETKEKSLSGESEQLKSELDKMKKEALEPKKENGKEMKETNEASEGNSELDDLMLLVSDLDEKNAKYRAKLKDLGVELSSDEDEDEDAGDSDDGSE